MNGKILSFGEIMLRLSPANGGTIADSKNFDACYGGTEANVLACLSNLGHDTKYITALPDTELGVAAEKHISSFGIDTSNIIKRGDVLGMYFTENGNGSRGSNVIYLRRFSEFTRLTETDVDYGKVFDGVSIFHISGISFALSESSRGLAYRLIREAKQRNIKVSFDFNYRAKLWNTEKAGEQFRQIIPMIDIVLASPLDLSVFLGIGESDFFKTYNSEFLFLRDRKIISPNKHSVKITVYHNQNGGVKEKYESPVVEFDVVEKIGGGDAFNGAVLHCLLSGCDIKNTAQFAIAAFALKHRISGDTFIGTSADIESYRKALGV